MTENIHKKILGKNWLLLVMCIYMNTFDNIQITLWIILRCIIKIDGRSNNIYHLNNFLNIKVLINKSDVYYKFYLFKKWLKKTLKNSIKIYILKTQSNNKSLSLKNLNEKITIKHRKWIQILLRIKDNFFNKVRICCNKIIKIFRTLATTLYVAVIFCLFWQWKGRSKNKIYAFLCNTLIQTSEDSSN